MLIEIPVNISPPQDLNNKNRKNSEEDAVKPVEESSGGDTTELNIEKDEISENNASAVMTIEREDVGDIYGSEGRLIRDHNVDQNPPKERQSIDIIV